ncbi:EF-hand calcium-binding domain-containing protein 6 isoform X2 [Acanthochromis polyacanthus]|uniref:EF-hand calcium-binding domain-containing protein 6 isoform X2 n=1 Tax=Acanthochromis polyacanthus TaxID=80966 RepID=UPI0022340F9E|nr:EF-hand calcium-binding domain-containing protein 6 isoform X2 [Acanthochromis polyacanthus]
MESLLPSITSDHKVNLELLAAPVETPYIHEDKEDTAEEQKTADEKQTTQWADKVSVASASWRTVEDLLPDKLCEQLCSVLAALKLYDPQHTGHVTQDELKKVLSCYGMPMSDAHFKKLCMSSSSSRLGRADSCSTMVSYSDFLRNLGVPLTDVTNTSCCSHKNTAHTERPFTSSQSTLQSIRQQSPCSQQTGLDTSGILDVVFQRMRLRLEQRQTSLGDRIQALIHTADEDEETLSEADVQKILEDTWVILDDKHFSRFTEMLGFRGGRIQRSVFQAKYEEATAREQPQDSKEKLLHTSAEQCLAAMRTRIQTIHGDHLTMFRLMDRKRKGVVDCQDFKALYDSLKFFCSKGAYQRLLDLIGLHPGNNLNYAEFVSVVENGGRQQIPTASIQQQLHELLAHEARSKWAAMSQVLCQFDKQGQGWIYKKSLRGLLFTYALPIRPNEFEEFWLRYDPEGRGYVKVYDFLERLGLHHDEELMSESLKLNQTVVQQDADRPISSDATELEHIKLKVSMDYNCRRFSYLDFLSALSYEAEKYERPPASPDVESLDSLSPHMALVRMRELVSASAHHLYKAFSAFDQSRIGMVRALDFRQVLQNFSARLSDIQYRYMLTTLQLDAENCTVNWKDFLNKFQLQSLLLLERAQRGSRQQRTSGRSPTQTKAAGVTELLQQILTLVSGHLYEISRELVDLDPSKSVTVSKDHFRQLCDRHHLRLTNDQFECVWSQMPVNEQRKLQYREFLKRFGAPSRTHDTEPSAEPTETQRGCSDADAVLLLRTKLDSNKEAEPSRGGSEEMDSILPPSAAPGILSQWGGRKQEACWAPWRGGCVGRCGAARRRSRGSALSWILSERDTSALPPSWGSSRLLILR